MSRAVKNLFDNAERHAHSRVVLALEELDGYAVLAVERRASGGVIAAHRLRALEVPISRPSVKYLPEEHRLDFDGVQV